MVLLLNALIMLSWVAMLFHSRREVITEVAKLSSSIISMASSAQASLKSLRKLEVGLPNLRISLVV